MKEDESKFSKKQLPTLNCNLTKVKFLKNSIFDQFK